MGLIKILQNIGVPQEIIDKILTNGETINKEILVNMIESYIIKIEPKNIKAQGLIDEIKKNIIKYKGDKDQISGNDDADDLLKGL